MLQGILFLFEAYEATERPLGSCDATSQIGRYLAHYQPWLELICARLHDPEAELPEPDGELEEADGDLGHDDSYLVFEEKDEFAKIFRDIKAYVHITPTGAQFSRMPPDVAPGERPPGPPLPTRDHSDDGADDVDE